MGKISRSIKFLVVLGKSFSLYALQALNEKFPKLGNGKDGMIFKLELLHLGTLCSLKKLRLDHLYCRIITTIETVTSEMFHKTWFEMDYSQVTNSAHNKKY
ncbi:hypothetical protein AVEN_180801-1 [Araneus ventricosus]|uniref:Uncharacterized protein n=1 Tax=Araneus ventricosus TaxID=182803 RepID=A0A4Y2WYR8_ARAVE|nr:hypothetical protein AVEN_163778-1 [Araneus ventricosus]GBO42411.1 hypothetical protein AVEN_180801-1 [Araneus ventricosus]